MKVKPSSDSKEYSKRRGNNPFLINAQVGTMKTASKFIVFQESFPDIYREKFSNLNIFNKDGKVIKVGDGGDYRLSDQFVPPFSAAKVSVFSRL